MLHWVDDFLLPPLLAWIGMAGIVLLIKCRERAGGGTTCGTCGYDLRAHAEHSCRCPECGSFFELDDVGVVMVMRRIRWLRVILGVSLIVAAALAVLWLYILPLLMPPDPPAAGMPI